MKNLATATILLAALTLAGCGEQTAVGDSPEAANGVSAKDAAPANGRTREGSAVPTSGKPTETSGRTR